jgi:hypothetical protein
LQFYTTANLLYAENQNTQHILIATTWVNYIFVKIFLLCPTKSRL